MPIFHGEYLIKTDVLIYQTASAIASACGGNLRTSPQGGIYAVFETGSVSEFELENRMLAIMDELQNYMDDRIVRVRGIYVGDENQLPDEKKLRRNRTRLVAEDAWYLSRIHGEDQVLHRTGGPAVTRTHTSGEVIKHWCWNGVESSLVRWPESDVKEYLDHGLYDLLLGLCRSGALKISESIAENIELAMSLRAI